MWAYLLPQVSRRRPEPVDSCLTCAASRLVSPPVATGFPAGQTPMEARLQEVRTAVADGATEVDVVINRTLALTGQWEGLL